MRRSICELTKPSARRELRLAGISTSTTADVHIRVLTAAPRIKPTSTRCHSAWQPKPGRASTYRRGDFVQTSGTSSHFRKRSKGFHPLCLQSSLVRPDHNEEGEYNKSKHSSSAGNVG